MLYLEFDLSLESVGPSMLIYMYRCAVLKLRNQNALNKYTFFHCMNKPFRTTLPFGLFWYFFEVYILTT